MSIMLELITVDLIYISLVLLFGIVWMKILKVVLCIYLDKQYDEKIRINLRLMQAWYYQFIQSLLIAVQNTRIDKTICYHFLNMCFP